MFKIVAITALLLGISPFGVAQVTSASNIALPLVKTESRNVTSIAKNQIIPSKLSSCAILAQSRSATAFESTSHPALPIPLKDEPD